MPVIKILVLRFSAMGDVALIVPVLRSLVKAHPNVEVTVVTRPRFAPFFNDLERVTAFSADVDHTYNGIFGIRELFGALIRRASYDYVIDLHDHIRTVMLRTLFKLFFTDVVVFDKGRKEKKAFARKQNKVISPLPHTVERYRSAFLKAGLSFELLPPPHFAPGEEVRATVAHWLVEKGLQKKEPWIGLAPFAMHASKIWPLENWPKAMEEVLQTREVKFFLFGGGEKEIRFFESLENKFPGTCVVVAGQLKLHEEIGLMTHLDMMVCTDSANMHLSALAGVTTLSVWGGTHPAVGFAPLGNNNTLIQIVREELPCRPCSVYGRATCYVGGFPCLTRISPALIAGQVLQTLSDGATATRG